MFIPIGDDIERDAAPIPFTTIVVLGVCLAVFGYQVNLTPELYERFFYSFGLVPSALFYDAPLPAGAAVIPAELTLVTSMFAHGDVMHFIGNMIFLWVFGLGVEEATGHMRFAAFYLLCGLAAAFGQALAEPNSMLPMIGASGAISGVMGAYFLVYPYRRVRVLYFLLVRAGVFTLPALVVIGFWIAMQMWSMLTAEPGAGGVAWTAHVGGFVAGMLLIPFFKRSGVRIFDTRVPT